tara:strand:+ start:202 stop:381 length:180 start_codon:yes stop_codon:yes gene_type:complete
MISSKFDLNLKLWKESIFFLKNQRIFNFGKTYFMEIDKRAENQKMIQLCGSSSETNYYP